MKLTLFFLSFTCFSFSKGNNVTVEEAGDLDQIGLRFLFNHGAVSRSGHCSADDLAIFEGEIYSQVFGMSNDGKELRSRQLWPAYCKNNCAGYPQNQCRATGCKGYRRKTMEGEEEVFYFESKGPVSSSSPPFLAKCAEEKEQALATIADLSSKLSRSCQALFSKPMDIQCFMYLN
jgi:hypothetical protein